ncbi:MAG: bifunctional 4-hydroxy-3-methylbut-2-enyl diphosphate reductase/30S ribosomal protein S1 [Caldicoprobacterales bacterium]
MKIILAPNAGFCFGVRRAIDSVYENLDQALPLYTLGPIIHNPSVVEELNKKGVRVAETVEDVAEGKVVIRSHGVGKEIYDQIASKELEYIDATCPYVKRIHKLVGKHHKNGYEIIIIGENNHPEVIGIKGWCDNQAYVINNIEDVKRLPDFDKACVVAQTTTALSKWDELVNQLKHKVKDLTEYNTICYATAERQKEAESIAKAVDVMLVIGGKNSSNTKKLYNICKSYCENTFAIETVDDIDFSVFDSQDVVGVTAGASTPDWIIKEVIEKMNVFDENSKERINEAINETQKVVNDTETAEEKNIKADETQQFDSNKESNHAGITIEETSEETISEEKSDNEITAESDNDSANENVETTEKTEKTTDEVTTMEGFEETMVSLRPGQIVKGKVLSVNPSEVIINVGYKSDGILPVDEISLEEGQTPLDVFKPGDEAEVEVLKVNDGEGNVVLSRKSVERRQAWKAIENGFRNQEEFKAVCTEAVKGGVIARINGIRAFVPASQLSNRYVEDLSTFVGQTLRLRIIELERSRRRVVASQRVILEAEEEARRHKLFDSLEEGQRIKGVVKRLTNFGAFVDIGGVDGLIHISDLSWGHVKHPNEVLSEDENVEVVVLSVDKENERISLGYKQTLPHPWDNVEEKYPVGSTVRGKVVRITSFGAFIELEPGVDGLVHISQVSNKRIQKVEDELSIGQEINAKVLDSNSETRRISLSIRELLPKEEAKSQPPMAKEKQEQFQKEDMTITLGEFFPEDFN